MIIIIILPPGKRAPFGVSASSTKFLEPFLPDQWTLLRPRFNEDIYDAAKLPFTEVDQWAILVGTMTASGSPGSPGFSTAPAT